MIQNGGLGDMKKTGLLLVMIAALLLFSASISSATNITYTAVNLSDVTPGVDLWQYSYAVSGFTFDADYGFTVYFDETLYSDLANPSANADWDPIVLQPVPDLPAAGVYDALALNDVASLADPFTLEFIWLGIGTPGAQPFEVYSLDSSGALTVLEEGQTTAAAAPVPEPATMLLFGPGLAALAYARKRLKVS